MSYHSIDRWSHKYASTSFIGAKKRPASHRTCTVWVTPLSLSRTLSVLSMFSSTVDSVSVESLAHARAVVRTACVHSTRIVLLVGATVSSYCEIQYTWKWNENKWTKNNKSPVQVTNSSLLICELLFFFFFSVFTCGSVTSHSVATVASFLEKKTKRSQRNKKKLIQSNQIKSNQIKSNVKKDAQIFSSVPT